MFRNRLTTLLALLLVATPATAQDVAGDLWTLDGALHLRARHRAHLASDVGDANVFSYIDLTGTVSGEDERTMLVRVSGAGVFDANSSGETAEPFLGLADTHANNYGYLYSAYAELPVGLLDADLRVGRQDIYREQAIFFDGARLDFPLGDRMEVVAFGGTPVHFHDEVASSDEYVLGGGLRLETGANWELGLDEIMLRDSTAWFGQQAADLDRLTLLTARGVLANSMFMRASASWLGEESSRQSVAARWVDPAGVWRAHARVERQFTYNDQLTTDFSPFLTAIGTIAPYWLTSVDVYRSLGDNRELGIGGMWRELVDGADMGLYNRDMGRYFLVLHDAEFLQPAVDAGIRADYWDSEGTQVTAGGAFIGYEGYEGARLEVGSDFSLYRYDLFTGREYINDRQLYGRLRYKLTDDIDLRFRYVFERSDAGDEQIVELGLTYSF